MADGLFSGSGRPMHGSNSVPKQCEVDENSKNTHKGSSFVRVLDHVDSKQLQLPPEFMINKNGTVPYRIIIENVSTKKCWRVQVEKDLNGETYFRDGWGEFVKSHSLEVGDVLVFEHEEHSIFLVKVYSTNGCEKIASLEASGSHHMPEEPNCESKEHNQDEFSESGEKIEMRKFRRPRRAKGELPPNDDGVNDPIRQRYDSRWPEKFSINGFSIMMQPKKHQFHTLTLPAAIYVAKKLSSINKVVLEDARGTHWEVNLVHKRDGRGVLSLGWKQFLDGNEVAGGDKLNFEFISDSLIKVRVTKPMQDSKEAEPSHEPSSSSNMDCEADDQMTHSSNGKGTKASTTSTKAKSSGSRRTSFSFTWNMSRSGLYFLHLPRVIILDQNLTDKKRFTLQDPQGRCWPVEVKAHSDGRMAFAKGWREFRKEHFVSAGDTFIFDFVSDNLVQVEIVRCEGESAPPAAQEADTSLSSVEIDAESEEVEFTQPAPWDEVVCIDE